MSMMPSVESAGPVSGVPLLDHLTHGILLFDSFGEVVFANQAAAALLSGGGPLRLIAGQLRASSSRVQHDLNSAIAAACRAKASRVVRIEAADGRSRLIVLSTLRSALSPVGYGPVVAMAFVSDVGCAPSVPLERLAQTYQLTDSEARIALAAASGEAPGKIAAKLRLSANTIKTHLRRVYEKLGIHRQAELVRLMSVLGLYQVYECGESRASD